ncbi:uncharacterized protein HKW66_Vig0087300 [Vigna angularis]|uniref:Uncharacterized protein n=1 Tax=Phaseolus angularis TaxID=3914 RepID=A0A8T0KI26_PHAAN|nr:uncharacterized protein HKW66_Vig0087300 [Vigna angularis]
MPADGVEDDAGTETEEEVEDNAGTETEEGVEDDVGTETEEEVEDDADTETEAEVGDDADTVTEAEVGDDAESPSSTCTGFSAMKIQRRFYLELYEDKGRIAQIFNTYLCLDDGRVVSNFVAQVRVTLTNLVVVGQKTLVEQTKVRGFTDFTLVRSSVFRGPPGAARASGGAAGLAPVQPPSEPSITVDEAVVTVRLRFEGWVLPIEKVISLYWKCNNESKYTKKEEARPSRYRYGHHFLDDGDDRCAGDLCHHVHHRLCHHVHHRLRLFPLHQHCRWYDEDHQWEVEPH